MAILPCSNINKQNVKIDVKLEDVYIRKTMTIENKNIDFDTKSGCHILTASVQVPAALMDVWNYFANPNNLVNITPPRMNFEITSVTHPERGLFQGQMITYKVSPFKGFRTSWVTEITAVKEMEYFIDEQRFGPYKLWHHEHHFKVSGQGTFMQDYVYYKLPVDVFSVLNKTLVKKQLEEIFSYRTKKIKELFG